MPQVDHRLQAKQLRERRAPLGRTIQELAERVNKPGEERAFTSEEQAAWQKANAEYNELTRQIEIHERAAEVEATQEQRDRTPPGRDDMPDTRHRGQPSDATRALALQAWARSHRYDLTDEQRAACEQLGINPTSRDLVLNLPSHDDLRGLRSYARNCPANRMDLDAMHARALGSGQGSTGGYTVPEGFARTLEVNMLAHGPMLAVADLMRTQTGEDFPWPTADDTSNEGEMLGENQQTADNDDPTFGALTLKAYWFSSKIIRVPIALLQDSAFDLATFLGAVLGERLGRRQNREFTTGLGAAGPTGVVTAASLGVTAAATNAIGADEVIELQHSVDPAYRAGARYMFHDNVLLALRKLKTGDGQYLWQPSMREGEPDRLHGAPISINQHMATPAANAKTMLYGNFSKYKIRQVRQIVFRRLVERYADYNQEGFLAFIRADGGLLDAGTAPIKYLQQAAA